MLKDLFIPHRLNNYQPGILHPKRLLFHGVSAILIKVFVLVSLLVLPASGWLTPDVMTEQSREIIKLTNNLRQEAGLKLLQESVTLNQAAYNKVQDMMVSQYFSHVSPSKLGLADWLKSANYPYAVAGENLAMGFSSAKQVVTAWQKSKTHNSNLLDSDYKEIGVAMISGAYKKHDTTIVAQYFGTQKVASVQTPQVLAKKPIPSAETNLTKNSQIALNTSPSVKGIKIESEAVVMDTTPPTIDLTRTKIFLNQPFGQEERIVKIIAFLSADATEVTVSFDNHYLALQKAPQEDHWIGSMIIPAEDAEKIFDPVVLASLTAKDSRGNTVTADIDWENIETIKPSLISQYQFIKNSSFWGVKTLVGASKVYFLLILIIGVIALLLNIFIEIRKQHLHLIFSTLGLIFVMAILLIL